MSNYFNNIKEIVDAKDLSDDRGNVVEYVIITAVVVITAVLVMGWIMSAVQDKGKEISEGISSAGPVVKSKG